MATYTVCATSGDDCNDGITKPFLTIQRAAEIASPGDTVLVQPGIYRAGLSNEKWNIDGSHNLYFCSTK